MPVIDVRDVTVQYRDEDRPALQHVSLQVTRGDWIALIGHNGSGKSTLARALDGLVPLTAGTIHVAEIPVDEEHIWDVRRRVGMVFQNPDNQFVGADVAGDVAFSLENQEVPREEMHRRVAAALKAVGMAGYANHAPSRLSGGQKQRVAIAGVLALRPEIVIFDEATSMLDPAGRDDVVALMRTLHEQGLTIITITHDIDEAGLADRVIMLDNGRVVTAASPATVFAQEDTLVARGLDVPYSARLKQALAARGVRVPKEYLTNEGMVNWLSQLKSTI